MEPVRWYRPTRRAPVLYGALVVGTLVAIIATGWVLLSPSLLLQRQVASATTQPAETEPSAQPSAQPVERVVRGQVLDGESGAPLAGASVWTGSTETRTNDEGRFTTDPLKPGASYLVKVPGYGLRRLTADTEQVTVRLPPKVVRAAYLTYYGVATGYTRAGDRVVARTEPTPW